MPLVARGGVRAEGERAPVLAASGGADVIAVMPVRAGLDEHEIQSHLRGAGEFLVLAELGDHAGGGEVGAVVNRRVVFAGVAGAGLAELAHQIVPAALADFLRVVAGAVLEIRPLLAARKPAPPRMSS